MACHHGFAAAGNEAGFVEPPEPGTVDAVQRDNDPFARRRAFGEHNVAVRPGKLLLERAVHIGFRLVVHAKFQPDRGTFGWESMDSLRYGHYRAEPARRFTGPPDMSDARRRPVGIVKTRLLCAIRLAEVETPRGNLRFNKFIETCTAHFPRCDGRQTKGKR